MGKNAFALLGGMVAKALNLEGRFTNNSLVLHQHKAGSPKVCIIKKTDLPNNTLLIFQGKKSENIPKENPEDFITKEENTAVEVWTCVLFCQSML